MADAKRKARENRILKMAEAILARRKKEARAAGFAEAETVMIRWEVKNATQLRLGLSRGYDSVTVEASRVAPMVRALIKRAAS